MKKLTVSDLMTILKINESLKSELEKNFEEYRDNVKDDILKILWDGVHELESRLAKLRYEEYLDEVDEGKRELTTDLYNEAVKSVWRNFDDILAGKIKDIEQIESIRASLQLPQGINSK